jgi:hypothetical protein
VTRLKRPYRAGKEFIYINSGLISQITRLKYAFSEKVECDCRFESKIYEYRIWTIRHVTRSDALWNYSSSWRLVLGLGLFLVMTTLSPRVGVGW